jgi:hypothetical protein
MKMAKKYVNWGAGWLKSTSKGDQYISGVAGTKDGLKVILRNSNGQELEITNFAVFFATSKKSDKAPDVNFTLTVEE